MRRFVISWLKLQLHLQSTFVNMTASNEGKRSVSLHTALVMVEILFHRAIQPHTLNISLARTDPNCPSLLNSYWPRWKNYQHYLVQASFTRWAWKGTHFFLNISSLRLDYFGKKERENSFWIKLFRMKLKKIAFVSLTLSMSNLETRYNPELGFWALFC